MVKLGDVAACVALYATALVSPVFADSLGHYLYDPPLDNEANVYARVIELQHAGAMNGKLLATWEHWYTTGPESTTANGTGGDYIIRESNDGGNSWSTLTTVHDPETGPGHPCAQFWQPFFFEYPRQLGKYPEGTILLVGNIVPANGSFTEFFAWRSFDHGQSWDPAGAWQYGGTFGDGIWEPFLYLDKQGRLVAVFSDERDYENHSQMLVQVISEDGGDTWSDPYPVVAPPSQPLRPGMATVALMDNGEYVMSYEVCNLPNCHVHFKTSKDAVTWDASDLGTAVVTEDNLYPGESPYVIWDSFEKQLVLSSHGVWNVQTGQDAPEFHRAVFINKNYGSGDWYWSPSPWYVYNGSAVCNSNYSPNLLLLSKGVVRYTAPASPPGTTGLCSEKTGEAPIGVLPYRANFATDGQQGWIDFGGVWSVSGDEYLVSPVVDIDARAVTGSSGWTDYVISADVMISGDSGTVGLNTRVTSPNDGIYAFKGYTASINSTTGHLTVSRQADDTTVLDSSPHPGGIKAGEWYQLSFSVRSNKISATLSSEYGGSRTTVSTVDGTFARGMVGLLVNNGGGKFQNVQALPQL